LLDENDDRPCCPGLWSFDFGSSFSRHWSRWRRDRTNGSIFGTPELSRVETSDIFCTFRALGEVPCACHQFFSHALLHVADIAYDNGENFALRSLCSKL
jgi:hypothetical protein